MKKFKLKNIIKKLSAICGVFAVCGLSLFFVYDHKKETQKVDAVETQTILLLENYTFEINFVTDSIPSYQSTIKGNYTLYYFKQRQTVNDTYTYRIRLTLNFNQCATTAFNNGQEFRLNNLDTNNGQIFVFEKSNQIGFTDFRFFFDGFEYIQTQYPSDDYFQFQLWLNNDYDGYEIYNAIANPNDIQLNISNTIGWNLYLFSRIDPLIDLTAIVNYQIGENVGYENGYNTGYTGGYQEGYDDGVASQSSVIQQSYQQGYTYGYLAGSNEDEVTATAFSGILRIGLLPIDFFLSIFNFELLGINITGFIVALISVVLTYILIRKVL